MTTREAIIAEAMSWVGTPVIWGQCRKGLGVDCVGWIFGVAREMGLPEWKAAEPFRKGYRRPSPARLLDGLSAALERAERAFPGDILAIPVEGITTGPAHLAMLLPDRQIIHAYGRGIERVCKVPLRADMRVHSIWTWPSLGGGA